MTPEQFKKQFFVNVARKGELTEVRVGITLKAIITIDTDDAKSVDDAKDMAKNQIIEGVYGGRREEFRALLNDLLRYCAPTSHEYTEAKNNLIEFQRSL